MASITQKVTSYIQGVSQQPDHLKRPGQVRELVNGLPDVTHGLMKRPGSKVITELTNVDTNGKWFTIFRDDEEKYLGRVRDGAIRIWSIIDGSEKTVTYATDAEGKNPATDLDYLRQSSNYDLDILSVNDYTFVINKTRKVTMGEQSVNTRPHEAFVQIKLAEYNTEYDLIIASPDAVADKEVTSATGLATSSPPTERGGSGGKAGFKEFTVNGSGDKKNLRFSITTTASPTYHDPNGEEYDIVHWVHSTSIRLLNGGSGWQAGDTVNANMNGHNYSVTITSVSKSLSYTKLIPTTPFLTVKDQTGGTLKFQDILTHFKTDIERVTGWEAQIIGNGLYIKAPEKFTIYSSGGRTDDTIYAFTNKANNVSYLPTMCKDGYVVKILNTGELDDDYYVKFIGTEPGVDGAGAWEETVEPGIPININNNTMPYQLVRQADGTFLCSPVAWDDREVGDERTNSQPSFVGDYINKIFFYRNRLGFLSNENIILSRPGDFFNFWVNTAITVSDADPIDLAATSLTPCELHDALGTKVGLLLFSRDRQFFFGTSQDVLTPSTAKIETYSTYVCNEHLPVIDMGTTVSFFGRGGKYSRLFEMTKLSDTQAPDILEQSKIVSEYLPADINEVCQSKENTLLASAKRGSSDVYLYRYFNDGQERIQSSWFRWKLRGSLQYHTVDKDIYYSVEEHNGAFYLAKTDLTAASDSDLLQSSDVVASPCLDLRTTVAKAQVTYDSVTDVSTFTTPYTYASDAEIVAFDDGKNNTAVGIPITIGLNPTEIQIKGDWTYSDLSIGYPFNFEVDLPHIYYTKQSDRQSVTDTRAYLNIHRVNLRFADSGLVNTKVNYSYKDPFTLTWEQSPANRYKANTQEVVEYAPLVVPCYDKNTNFNIQLSSSTPFPVTLLSMEWEGRINSKSYTSV